MRLSSGTLQVCRRRSDDCRTLPCHHAQPRQRSLLRTRRRGVAHKNHERTAAKKSTRDMRHPWVIERMDSRPVLDHISIVTIVVVVVIFIIVIIMSSSLRACAS
jgi:hypothetical protein